MRLDPDLPSLVKKVWIMGGTSAGKGNYAPASEFNFYCDPEGAAIVFEAFEQNADLGAKITLYCWEQCMEHTLSWDFFDGLVGRKEKPETLAGSVLKEVAGAIERTTRVVGASNTYNSEITKTQQFLACDSFAAAVMIDPSIVTESQTLHVLVCLAS